MKTYYSSEFVQSPLGHVFHHLKNGEYITECGKTIEHDWWLGGYGIPSIRIENFCKKCMKGEPFIIVVGGIVQ
jgi:hypothetical protein